jgi:ATP-dependent RNA helicase DHX57
VEKGFRKAHAIESAMYASSLHECIDWLMLYVPEDDLPASFHSSTTLALSTGSASLASLAKEYSVKRMVGSGLSRRDAEEAYDACGGVETEAVAMNVLWNTENYLLV